MYDVTEFAPTHPGASAFLLRCTAGWCSCMLALGGACSRQKNWAAGQLGWHPRGCSLLVMTLR